MFARKEFQWDEQMYTKFQTCTISKEIYHLYNLLSLSTIISTVLQLCLLWPPS